MLTRKLTIFLTTGFGGLLLYAFVALFLNKGAKLPNNYSFMKHWSYGYDQHSIAFPHGVWKNPDGTISTGNEDDLSGQSPALLPNNIINIGVQNDLVFGEIQKGLYVKNPRQSDYYLEYFVINTQTHDQLITPYREVYLKTLVDHDIDQPKMFSPWLFTLLR